MNLPPPHASPARTFDFHDATVRVSREYAGAGRLAQPLHLSAQFTILLFKFEDPRDSSQIDALFLTELLRLHKAEYVPQRVSTGTASRTPRHDQPEAIILP